MKITCPHCQKSYEIPDERFSKLGDYVTFPCPACKGKIEINLTASAGQATSAPEPSKELPTGEVLKKRILRTIDDLAPMPQVAQKARELTANEDASFQDLAKIIETDQAIATRVLKLSNSSFYGQMGKVTSIQHAAVVLGLKTLNELLTLACAASLLGSELQGYEQGSGDMWQHSLAVAHTARKLAEQKDPGSVEDAFSAGLIHDCGKLILDKYILERKAAFQESMQAGDKSFLASEREILGFDHAQIASDVCQKWQIPKQLVRAVEYHHRPSGLTANYTLAYIVHAADAIALMSGIGAGMDGMMYQLDDRVMKELELNSEIISMLMVEAAEFVDKTVSAG
ncbi:MAG: HDOD domain-containing protein [Deltaproteobacteria bacterium]|nr:HDOD domain-containing protein [Deltaproteobacteria bacterium]